MNLVGPNSGYSTTLRLLCSFKRQEVSESLALHGAQGTQKHPLLHTGLVYHTYAQKTQKSHGLGKWQDSSKCQQKFQNGDLYVSN